MLRILAFVLALMLLAGSVDPTRGWLITLVVLTGLAALRPRPWSPFTLHPALDVRLGAFILAVLLLAGVVESNRDWLMALSAVTGVAAFMPGLVSLDGDRRQGWHEMRPWRSRRWQVWDAEDWP